MYDEMELEIGIEILDPKLVSDLFETTKPSVSQEKTIAEGVSIRIKNYYSRDAVDLPTILNIIARISEHVALPIAVGILSNYLYDKLKKRKNRKVMINYIQVEINAEKIKELIIEIIEKKHDSK
jgi:hypothetical protein